MIEAAERAGPPQARRDDHRADLRQHRPRPRHRRRPQGLPLHLRHGRQAVDGEAGPAPCLWRRGRALPDERRARVAGELLLRRRAPRPRHSGRLQARPVLEPGEPDGPRADDRPGDLGPDRGPDHPLRRERRHGRHDHRRRSLPEGEEAGAGDRRRGPGGLGPVRRHRPALPHRGRRRGLLPGHVRRGGRRSVGPRLRPRRLRDGPPDHPGGGDPRRRIVRHGHGRGPRRGPPADARGGRRRRERDHRRDLPGRRPELPLQALQRRVDAGQRPAHDDGSGGPDRRGAARAPPRQGAARRGARPDHGPGRCRDRPAPALRHQPAARLRATGRRRDRGDHRLGQREGPAGPGLPRPERRRADGGRGHGPAAARPSMSGRRSTTRSPCCRAARRPSSRRRAAARRASSRSSTCWSSWPTGARVATEDDEVPVTDDVPAIPTARLELVSMPVAVHGGAAGSDDPSAAGAAIGARGPRETFATTSRTSSATASRRSSPTRRSGSGSGGRWS